MFITCSFSRKDDCGSIRIRSGGTSEKIDRPLHHRWLMLFRMLNLLWLRWWWGNPQSFHWIWTRAATPNPYRDYTSMCTKNRVSHLIFIIMSLNVAQAEERCIISFSWHSQYIMRPRLHSDSGSLLMESVSDAKARGEVVTQGKFSCSSHYNSSTCDWMQ